MKIYEVPSDGIFKCCECKDEKYFTSFSKDPTVSRGIKYRCKDCENNKRINIRKNDLEKSRQQMREYARKRRSDIKNRIRLNLGTRLYLAVNKKHGNTMELTGCSKDELMRHLESKFTEGMSWNNYGQWHIDHIKPCSSFDLIQPEEQYKCFHWSNLQPLWAVDNMKKGSSC